MDSGGHTKGHSAMSLLSITSIFQHKWSSDRSNPPTCNPSYASRIGHPCHWTWIPRPCSFSCCCTSLCRSSSQILDPGSHIFWTCICFLWRLSPLSRCRKSWHSWPPRTAASTRPASQRWKLSSYWYSVGRIYDKYLMIRKFLAFFDLPRNRYAEGCARGRL